MDVYFDKENLRSYVASSANATFKDCNRMLANKFNLHFSFDKKDIMQDSDIKQWITTMTSGFKGNVHWNETHPNRPLKSNSHTTFNKDQLSSIYLLDDAKITLLHNSGILLYGVVGQELSILSSLIVDADYKFVKQLQIKKLSNWSDIRSYTSPCSDIILVDKYIFIDDNLYTFNVYSLVKELCYYAKNAKINIVIFTLPSIYDRNTKLKFTPNWEGIRQGIKKLIKATIGIEPNVTFVLSSNLDEHDRSIFTNYKSIESGDSFNYFDSKGNVISKGRHIEVFSLADNEYYENYMQFVADMQNNVIDVKKINKNNIIGDKVCNYLVF